MFDLHDLAAGPNLNCSVAEISQTEKLQLHALTEDNFTYS